MLKYIFLFVILYLLNSVNLDSIIQNSRIDNNFDNILVFTREKCIKVEYKFLLKNTIKIYRIL